MEKGEGVKHQPAGSAQGDSQPPSAARFWDDLAHRLGGDVYRLIYFSRSELADDVAGWANTVRAILDVSRSRNARLGVTGALAFNGTNFIQVLEGRRSAVLEVYGSIERDPRHADVLVVEQGPVARREFADWAMAYVGEPNEQEVALSGTRLATALVNESGRGAAILAMMRYFLHPS